MKILEKLIKIVFISAIITGPSFASEARYNFDDQVKDNEATVARLGFISSTKLRFTQESVDTILDPRFDYSHGKDPEIRSKKAFLLGTVQGALFMPGTPKENPETESPTFFEIFRTALEKNKGVIEIDITLSYEYYRDHLNRGDWDHLYSSIQAQSGKALWVAIYTTLHPSPVAASYVDRRGIPIPHDSATFLRGYYNLDDQDNDTAETMVKLGFVSSTKLRFTQPAVEVILDDRFDPSLGSDPETRRKKTFLLGTVQGAFFRPSFTRGDPENERSLFFQRFYTALKMNKGVIEIDLPTKQRMNHRCASMYIEGLYPNPFYTDNGSSREFWFAIDKILQAPPAAAHEACSSHDGTSIVTVTDSVAALRGKDGMSSVD